MLFVNGRGYGTLPASPEANLPLPLLLIFLKEGLWHNKEGPRIFHPGLKMVGI
jgi:hypothetical protein